MHSMATILYSVTTNAMGGREERRALASEDSDYMAVILKSAMRAYDRKLNLKHPIRRHDGKISA